jgi:hypothetical protein
MPCFNFQNEVQLCLQWPLVKLFPEAWASSTGLCLVFLSLMSMDQSEKGFDHRHQMDRLLKLWVAYTIVDYFWVLHRWFPEPNLFAI